MKFIRLIENKLERNQDLLLHVSVKANKFIDNIVDALLQHLRRNLEFREYGMQKNGSQMR